MLIYTDEVLITMLHQMCNVTVIKLSTTPRDLQCKKISMQVPPQSLVNRQCQNAYGCHPSLALLLIMDTM